MFKRITKWMKAELKKWDGEEEEQEPWYVKAHVGFCPFCGGCAHLPADVEKGSGAKVRCGRRKDGTTSGGCGRDLFA